MMLGGLKVVVAVSTYRSDHLAKARFSAPDRRIFWMPLINAYTRPRSLAVVTMVSWSIFICTRALSRLIASVAMVITKLGTTRLGAKAKICPR